MSNCNMKQGFFFLRDCENPAQETCCVCQKQFCMKHLRHHPSQDGLVCLDCLGKLIQQEKDTKKYRSDYHSAAWGYGYRHRYYEDEGYLPYYSGHTHNDDFFDSHDVRSFDSSHGDDLDAEDFDAEANAFDS